MIIKPEVFDDRRLPRDLKYREPEVETLSRALDPALAGQPPEDVLLAGPSGVGKTALARHTLSRLDEFTAVAHTHVRCLGETTGEILRTALREYPGTRSVPATLSLNDTRQQLADTVDQPFVLVLDEADDLPETDVLDTLASIPLVSVVAICHEPQPWLARAPDDVRRDIIGPVTVERFSVDELASILRARANQGLRPDVVDDEQLRRIADEVAGVAREGIQALRAAAELAGERGHSRIRDVDIAESFARAQHEIRQANLSSLAFHHHVLYAVVFEAGEIGATELHDRYDDLASSVYYGRPQQAVGRRARRYKLSKLREYDLIDWDDDATPRTYRVVDESVEPRLDLSLPSA
ncbi:Cdc6/Cdc18 family protein [Halorussus halobius]|uniref:Cdc6/Cdc18 family protein n=1 Tax=Halorussus halobius TaxID=1710537 RepID=UPI001092F8B4|nr:AAA family ATPase [Halorussus halobius]